MLKEVEKLTAKPLEEWPTYSSTINRKTDEDGKKFYQSQELKHFEIAHTYYTHHYQKFCQKLTDCVKQRLAMSDLGMMRDIIVVLSTHGWEKLLEENDKIESIGRLIHKFLVPLESAGAVVEEIEVEFHRIMDYAVQNTSVSTMDYRSVWWQLFNTPHSQSEWRNGLLLVELLFSLPASGGEDIYHSNYLKVKKRSLLSNQSLDDLLCINSNQVTSFDNFSPDAAINLRWSDKNS